MEKSTPPAPEQIPKVPDWARPRVSIHDCKRSILETDQSRHHLGIFRRSSGQIPAIMWAYSGHHLSIFRPSFGNIPAIIWAYSGHHLGIFRPSFGYIPSIIWSYFCHHLIIFYINTRLLLWSPICMYIYIYNYIYIYIYMYIFNICFVL